MFIRTGVKKNPPHPIFVTKNREKKVTFLTLPWDILAQGPFGAH
jgi:hypothetical protein